MSPGLWVRPFKRKRDGTYEVRLGENERLLLKAMPRSLDESLADSEGPPPEMVRLFPPAYADDPKGERSYQEVMLPDLVAHHRRVLQVVADTADSTELGEEQIAAWLGAINDMRLVLGTMLDVTEDDSGVLRKGDDADRFQIYGYLSYLVSELVDTMSGGLPPADPTADEDIVDPWGDPPDGLRWCAPGAPGGSK
ncbi:MAG TPA: DUF2017 family protein [Acidimicrobiales bacterium]|nr:DUF2017 family protein [Acidimicrobiales bacterium]